MAVELAQSAHDKLLDLRAAVASNAGGDFLQALDSCVEQLATCFPLKDRRVQPVVDLAGRLKRQKALTARAQAELEEELPKRTGNRMANLWYIRVGFAPANMPARSLTYFLRNFPASWTSAQSTSMSISSVTRTKDAFCEIIKDFNRQEMVKLVLQHPTTETAYISHIHDEVALRVRTKAQTPEDACQTYVCGRSNSSKVLSQVPHLHIGDQKVEYIVELQALLKKDGPTITHCLHMVLEAIIKVLCSRGDPVSSNERRYVFHLLVGDAINTNENAMKRLLQKMAEDSRIRYFLLAWPCASHQSNLCVSLAVTGTSGKESKDNMLVAICTRWYKYILTDYNEELCMNLRKWVWLSVEVYQTDGGFCMRLIEDVSGLRELYGERVIPDGILELCTGTFVRAEQCSLREHAFKQLYGKLA